VTRVPRDASEARADLTGIEVSRRPRRTRGVRRGKSRTTRDFVGEPAVCSDFAGCEIAKDIPAKPNATASYFPLT
jgi:hypothetical protein